MGYDINQVVVNFMARFGCVFEGMQCAAAPGAWGDMVENTGSRETKALKNPPRLEIPWGIFGITELYYIL